MVWEWAKEYRSGTASGSVLEYTWDKAWAKGPEYRSDTVWATDLVYK